MRHYLFVLLAALLFGQPLMAQTNTASEANTLLQTVISASGGQTALAQLKDFTATGTMTLYSGTEKLQGSVTIKGAGSDQFRLDASFSSGQTFSWYVSNGLGKCRRLNGKTVDIPYHNAIGLTSLTIPTLAIKDRLADSTAAVSLIAPSAGDDPQVQKVTVSRPDPLKVVKQPLQSDYLIDSATGQVIEIQDQAHPVTTADINFKHIMDFSDYTTVQGITVPFSIKEQLENVTTFEIHLTSITFNTGLSSSDFSF